MSADYTVGDTVQCVSFTTRCPRCNVGIASGKFYAPKIGTYYKVAAVVKARCFACHTQVQGMLPVGIALSEGKRRYAWFYDDFRKIEPGSESLTDLIARHKSKEKEHV